MLASLLFPLLFFTLGGHSHRRFITVKWRNRHIESPCLGDGIQSCVSVSINFDALWGQEVIEFIDGISLTRTLAISVPDPTLVAAQFESADGYAILVYSTKSCGQRRISGTINTDTRSFSIETSGRGRYVLMEKDTSMFNESDPVPGAPRSSEDNKEDIHPTFSARTLNADLGPTVYSIQFYYTPSFAATTPDITAFVNTIIAETNAGYMNSGVNLRAEIHCIEESTITTNEISDLNLENFKNSKGSHDATLNTADVAMLLTTVDPAGYCGIASFEPDRMSIVAKNCATGYFSAGHEIGHNFGCLHDRSTSGVGKKGNGYSYGYHIGSPTRTDKRTIMAYKKKGWLTRVNYYSSDTVLYNGYATGNADNDNARVLMENAARIANYGDESGTCGGATVPPPPPPPPTTAPPPPPSPPTTTSPPPPPTTTTTTTTSPTPRPHPGKGHGVGKKYRDFGRNDMKNNYRQTPYGHAKRGQ